MKISDVTGIFKSLTTRAKLRKLQRTCRSQGQQPVHFLHIGKTGGTAIRHVLKSFTRVNCYVIELHPHRVRLQDIPRGDHVVFFLRDPVSRYISAFYSRKRKGQPRFVRPWSTNEAIAFREFETPNSLAIALSSEEITVRKKAIHAMNRIRHVNDRYWDWFKNESYFLSRRDDIFFIGLQETLSNDFDRLKTKLGIPRDVKLPDDDIDSHRNQPHLDKTLDEQSITNIKEWYQVDYDFIHVCKALIKREEKLATFDT